MTYDEIYGPAMSITDQPDADQYFGILVERLVREGCMARADAERVTRENLAYYAGYYGDDTRRRVEKLFNCEHPIFGSIEKNGPPTAEEAFQKGLKLGQQRKDKQ